MYTSMFMHRMFATYKILTALHNFHLLFSYNTFDVDQVLEQNM